MDVKVLVIDDHPLVQAGVAAALESLGRDMRVMAARDGEQGMAMAAANPDLDLVLLDLALPGMSGLGLISRLNELFASLPVVVLSALEEADNVRQAIDAGAMGFVPKSAAPRVLLDVLRQVLGGNLSVPDMLEQATPIPNGHAAEDAQTMHYDSPLTVRQSDVLSRLCEGKTNKQIATDLSLSEKTVKAHVTAIFKALGVVNRTQAVLAAQRDRLN